MDHFAVSMRPVLPSMAVEVAASAPALAVALKPATPMPAAFTPAIPGPATGPQINDTVTTPGAVWSSARTAQEIDEAVTEQLYDYDALVAVTLNI